MKITYYPDADQLDIWFSGEPAEGGGAEVEEGILLFYDGQDKLVGLHVEQASERANLTDLLKDPARIDTALEPSSTIYSVSSLAQEWGIAERTLRRTLETMRTAGEQVGLQQAPHHPTLLTDEDAKKIKRWRAARRPGRPKQDIAAKAARTVPTSRGIHSQCSSPTTDGFRIRNARRRCPPGNRISNNQ